jgi:hypothetical protein
MKLAYRDEYQKNWNVQGRKGPLSQKKLCSQEKATSIMLLTFQTNRYLQTKIINCFHTMISVAKDTMYTHFPKSQVETTIMD